MSFNQALMAANAGASFVSLFYGRIRDTGYDASDFFDDGSAADGSGGWASGDKGRIARVTLAPAD